MQCMRQGTGRERLTHGVLVGLLLLGTTTNTGCQILGQMLSKVGNGASGVSKQATNRAGTSGGLLGTGGNPPASGGTDPAASSSSAAPQDLAQAKERAAALLRNIQTADRTIQRQGALVTNENRDAAVALMGESTEVLQTATQANAAVQGAGDLATARTHLESLERRWDTMKLYREQMAGLSGGPSRPYVLASSKAAGPPGTPTQGVEERDG